jgi:hypothetical protein
MRMCRRVCRAGRRFTFNVHDWLAAQMRRAAIAFKTDDNCIVKIVDWRLGARPGDGATADNRPVPLLHYYILTLRARDSHQLSLLSKA